MLSNNIFRFSLAVINGEDENDYIAAKTGGYSWIGFSDKSEEGTFRSVHGDTMSWKNWWTGEPNDAGGKLT